MEKEPITLKGEIVRCKGCDKILFEGDLLFEYPFLEGISTGFDYTYCSQDCALKNAFPYCVGCGKRFEEGDKFWVIVKEVFHNHIRRSIDFYCQKCKK